MDMKLIFNGNVTIEEILQLSALGFQIVIEDGLITGMSRGDL